EKGETGGSRQGGGGLLHARQVRGAAEKEGASFEPDGIRTKFDEIARIGMAVPDVIEPSGPLAGPSRAHPHDNWNAHKRTTAQLRIGIFLVGWGLPGLGIDPADARNGAAYAVCAIANAQRAAILVQPETVNIGTCRQGADECNGSNREQSKGDLKKRSTGFHMPLPPCD